jgi:hypothetical protein
MSTCNRLDLQTLGSQLDYAQKSPQSLLQTLHTIYPLYMLPLEVFMIRGKNKRQLQLLTLIGVANLEGRQFEVAHFLFPTPTMGGVVTTCPM